MSNTRLMTIVFNSETDPLFTREYASDKAIYQTYSTVQTNTAIWTPDTGKSIYLTAILVSAAVPITVSLNRASNQPFMTIILNNTLSSFGESFPSPLKLDPDEEITITTNAVGTLNISLIGYEI